MDVKNFLKVVSARRSNYKLGGSSPISGGEITEIVREIVRNSPSAFNSQSSRVAILFSESAKRFWEIVFETLSPKTLPENAGAFKNKIDSFAAAHGTILFFDDEKVTNATAEKISGIRKKFSALGAAVKRDDTIRRVVRAECRGAWRQFATLQPRNRRSSARRIRLPREMEIDSPNAFRQPRRTSRSKTRNANRQPRHCNIKAPFAANLF